MTREIYRAHQLLGSHVAAAAVLPPARVTTMATRSSLRVSTLISGLILRSIL